MNLGEIKSKVRALTGRPDTGQLSDADLLTYINRQYQTYLPLSLPGVPEVVAAVNFDTVAGLGVQALSSSTLAVEGPWFIEDADATKTQLLFYWDRTRFFNDFPPGDDTDSDLWALPQAVLLDGRNLYLRPIPDDADTVYYYHRTRTPTALSSDAHEPTNPAWGQWIALRTAREILLEGGENEVADGLLGPIQEEEMFFSRTETLQQFGRRAFPSF